LLQSLPEKLHAVSRPHIPPTIVGPILTTVVQKHPTPKAPWCIPVSRTGALRKPSRKDAHGIRQASSASQQHVNLQPGGLAAGTIAPGANDGERKDLTPALARWPEARRPYTAVHLVANLLDRWEQPVRKDREQCRHVTS
jgi:hypothetical protein